MRVAVMAPALVAVAAWALAGGLAAAAPPQTAAIAAPGWRLTPIATDIALASGATADGDAVIVSDLAEGRILRIAADGARTVLRAGLPVGLDVLGEPTGPYKVQVHEGRVFIAQGWQDAGREATALDHAVLALDEDGSVSVVNNTFWNPFDFAWGGDAWYVADAARNTLERLAPDGAMTRLFTFARLVVTRSDLRALSPTEFKGEETYTVDAVPTGIALAEGRIFVSLFAGFPFLEGSGTVVSLPPKPAAPAAPPKPAARARLEVRTLNAPVDIAFDAAGRLLVLEMGVFDLAAGRFAPGTGRLLRIDRATGRREALVTGLTRPITIAPLGAGAYIVVENSGGVWRLQAE